MIMVHVNSFSPATFSSQLCVLTERECTAVGKAHSVTMVGKKKYAFLIQIKKQGKNSC